MPPRKASKEANAPPPDTPTPTPRRRPPVVPMIPEAILPVHAHQAHIKHLVNDQSNPITVITAGTGSGKSTILPSILASMTFKNNPIMTNNSNNNNDDDDSNIIDLVDRIPNVGHISSHYPFTPNNVHFGTSHNARLVVITSPNKLSAVSVARRVAQTYESINRHNIIPHPQYGYIGYRVGLITDIDCVYDPKHAQIVFITDEAMVRLMIIDQHLLGIRHLILDEIHVRSLYSDVIMSRSRCLVAQSDARRNQRQRSMQELFMHCREKYNPEGTILVDAKDSNTNMCIIICSATIDTARFLRFMYNFPMSGTLTHEQHRIVTSRHQHISGDNYSVQQYYSPIRLINTSHNEQEDIYIHNVILPALFRHINQFASFISDDILLFVRDRGMVLNTHRILTVGLEKGLEITNLLGPVKEPKVQIIDPVTGLERYDREMVSFTFTSDKYDIIPIHDDLSPLDREEIMEKVTQRSIHLNQLNRLRERNIQLSQELQRNPSIERQNEINKERTSLLSELTSYVAQHNIRKMIYISDAICETSLTLPNVSLVVDTGRVYEERFDVNRRITINEEAYVTLDRANQRSGRSGRTCNGTCVRLYNKQYIDDPQRKSMKAQIQRVALNKVVLLLCSMGLNILDLSLIDPPPQRLAIFALEQLLAYGCIQNNTARHRTSRYCITDKGLLILNLPFEPDVSQMLHAARRSTLATVDVAPDPDYDDNDDDDDDSINENDNKNSNRGTNKSKTPPTRVTRGKGNKNKKARQTAEDKIKEALRNERHEAIATNSRNLLLMHQITTFFQYGHFKTHATETLQGIQSWLRHPSAKEQPSYHYVVECFRIIETTQSDLLLSWLTYRLYLGFHMPICTANLFNPEHIHLSLISDTAMIWYENMLHQRQLAGIGDECQCRQYLCESLSLEQSIITKSIETIIMTRPSLHLLNAVGDDRLESSASLEYITPDRHNIITLSCSISQYIAHAYSLCPPEERSEKNLPITLQPKKPKDFPLYLVESINLRLESVPQYPNIVPIISPLLESDKYIKQWNHRQNICTTLSFLSSLISAALFSAIEHRTSVPVASQRYLAGVILSYAWAGKIKANIDPHCTAVYFTDNPSNDLTNSYVPSVYPLISLTINQSDQKYFIAAAHPLQNTQLFLPDSLTKLNKLTDDISSLYAPAIVSVGPEVWAAAEIRLADAQAHDVRQQTEAYEKLLDVNVNAAVQGSDVAAVVENTHQESADINSLLTHRFAWSRFLAPSRWETATGSIILLQNIQMFCGDSIKHLLQFIRDSGTLMNPSPSIFLIRGEFDSFRVFIDSQVTCIGLQSLSLLYSQIKKERIERTLIPLIPYGIDMQYKQYNFFSSILPKHLEILPPVTQPIPHPSDYVFYAGKRSTQYDQFMYRSSQNYIISSNPPQQQQSSSLPYNLYNDIMNNITSQLNLWISSTTDLVNRHFVASTYDASLDSERQPVPFPHISNILDPATHIYDYTSMIIGVSTQHVDQFNNFMASRIIPYTQFPSQYITPTDQNSQSHLIKESITSATSTMWSPENGPIIVPRDIIALHNFISSLDLQWDVQQQHANSSISGLLQPFTPEKLSPHEAFGSYASQSRGDSRSPPRSFVSPIIPLGLDAHHPGLNTPHPQQLDDNPRNLHYFVVFSLPYIHNILSSISIPITININTRLGIQFSTYQGFSDINDYYKEYIQKTRHQLMAERRLDTDSETSKPVSPFANLNIPTHIHLAYHRYIDECRRNPSLLPDLPLPYIPLPHLDDQDQQHTPRPGSFSSLLRSHDPLWDCTTIDDTLPEHFRAQYLAYYFKYMEWRQTALSKLLPMKNKATKGKNAVLTQGGFDAIPCGYATSDYTAPIPPYTSALTIDHFQHSNTITDMLKNILSAPLSIVVSLVYPNHRQPVAAIPKYTYIQPSSSSPTSLPLIVTELLYTDSATLQHIPFLATPVYPTFITRLTVYNSHMFDLPSRIHEATQRYNVTLDNIISVPVNTNTMGHHPFAVHHDKYKAGNTGASFGTYKTLRTQLPQNTTHTLNFYTTNTPASAAPIFTEIVLTGPLGPVNDALSMLKTSTAPTVISTGNIRSDLSFSVLRLFNNNSKQQQLSTNVDPQYMPYYRTMDNIAYDNNVIITFELVEPNYLKDSFVHADDIAYEKQQFELHYDGTTGNKSKNIHLDQLNVLKEGSITIYGLTTDITNAVNNILEFDSLLKSLRKVYKNISPSVFTQSHSLNNLISIQREASYRGVHIHLDSHAYYAEILHAHDPLLVEEYANKIDLQLRLHAGTHVVKERRCCLCKSSSGQSSSSSDASLVVLNKCGHVICQSCLTDYMVNTINKNIHKSTQNIYGSKKTLELSTLCCPEARNSNAVVDLINDAKNDIINLQTMLDKATPGPYIDATETCCKYPLSALDLSHSLTYTNWSTILSNCIRQYLVNGAITQQSGTSVKYDMVLDYGCNAQLADKIVDLSNYFNPIVNKREGGTTSGTVGVIAGHNNNNFNRDKNESIVEHADESRRIRTIHKNYVDKHVNCPNKSCSILTINHNAYHQCNACSTSYCKVCNIVHDNIHYLLDCKTYQCISSRRNTLLEHFKMLVSEQQALINYLTLHTNTQLISTDVSYRNTIDSYIYNKTKRWFADSWKSQYPNLKIPTLYTLSPAKYNLPSYRRFINGLYFISNNISPDATVQYMSPTKDYVFTHPQTMVLQAERQYDMINQFLEHGTISYGYHGTCAHEAILKDGLDPRRRCGQVFGVGEYVAPQIRTSMAYSSDTMNPQILICLLLKIDSTHQQYCHVINNPRDWFSSYMLPVGYFTPPIDKNGSSIHRDGPIWVPPQYDHPPRQLILHSIETTRLNKSIQSKMTRWFPIDDIPDNGYDGNNINVILPSATSYVHDLVPQHHWQFIIPYSDILHHTSSMSHNNDVTNINDYYITLGTEHQQELSQQYMILQQSVTNESDTNNNNTPDVDDNDIVEEPKKKTTRKTKAKSWKTTPSTTITPVVIPPSPPTLVSKTIVLDQVGFCYDKLTVLPYFESCKATIQLTYDPSIPPLQHNHTLLLETPNGHTYAYKLIFS